MSHIHTRLTTADRDRLDCASRRIQALAYIGSVVLETGSIDKELAEESINEIMVICREEADAIHDVLERADNRIADDRKREISRDGAQ